MSNFTPTNGTVTSNEFIFLDDVYATTTGSFSFSYATTVPDYYLQNVGQPGANSYVVSARLVPCYGIGILNTCNVTTLFGSFHMANMFHLGEPNVGQQRFSRQVGALDAAMGSVASTTGELIENCNLFGAGNLFDCVYGIFLPSGPELLDIRDRVIETIGYKFPWGYGTRAVVILTGAATSSLPSLVITLPSEVPGAGEGVDLTPWSMLANDGMLATVESYGSDPKTLREITEDYWNFFIYFLFGIVVLSDLYNMGQSVSQSR